MHHRDIFKVLAIVGVVGAFAVPSVQAQDLRSPDVKDAADAAAIDLRSPDAQDAAGVSSQSPAAEVGNAASNGISAVQQSAVPTEANGFDWGDAGIGAGVALAAIALAGGAALLIMRRHPRPSAGATIAH